MAPGAPTASGRTRAARFARAGEKSSPRHLSHKEYEGGKTPPTMKDPNDNPPVSQLVPSYVFNAAQVDGYEPVIT